MDWEPIDTVEKAIEYLARHGGGVSFTPTKDVGMRWAKGSIAVHYWDTEGRKLREVIQMSPGVRASAAIIDVCERLRVGL